jgi:hypothetical protein
MEFISTKKAGDKFSKQDYLQFFDFRISDATAKNDIGMMVDSQICGKDGSGPATRYNNGCLASILS